jgi:hypothetical protein
MDRCCGSYEKPGLLDNPEFSQAMVGPHNIRHSVSAPNNSGLIATTTHHTLSMSAPIDRCTFAPHSCS